MKSTGARKKGEKETAEEEGVKAACGERGLYMRHDLTMQVIGWWSKRARRDGRMGERGGLMTSNSCHCKSDHQLLGADDHGSIPHLIVDNADGWLEWCLSADIPSHW
jgi:hypothetical protein